MSAYNAENPFEEGNAYSAPSPPPKQAPQPTNYNNNSNQNNRGADPNLLEWAERLHKKEAELDQRDSNLQTRSQILTERESMSPLRQANWPRCRPLVYHNLRGDMPTPEAYKMGRAAFIGWFGAVICLFWNTISLLAVLIESGSGQAIADFIISFIFIIFLAPLWFFIYRILYRAARKSKPSFYIIYFIMFSLNILTYIFFAIGVPGTGAAGFFGMIKGFKNSIAVGSIVLIAFVFWTAEAILGIYIWILARYQYRQVGGLAQAKREAGNAAFEEAKKNPELMKQGLAYGAQQAAQHPDLVVKGVSHAV